MPLLLILCTIMLAIVVAAILHPAPPTPLPDPATPPSICHADDSPELCSEKHAYIRAINEAQFRAMRP